VRVAYHGEEEEEEEEQSSDADNWSAEQIKRLETK
jgi:hypothetical protein